MPIVTSTQYEYICDICNEQIERHMVTPMSNEIFLKNNVDKDTILKNKKRLVCSVSVIGPEVEDGIVCKDCFKKLMSKYMKE